MLLTDNLLLDYKRCQRRAFLNRYGQPSKRMPEREFLQKLQRENQKQIDAILTECDYGEPRFAPGDWEEGAGQTEDLMRQGADLIYKGVLFWAATPSFPALLGQPTFLKKMPGTSRFGDWHYIPINVKLGKRPKPEYKAVGAFHAYLLAQVQGEVPSGSRLVLRDGREYQVALSNWLPRMEQVLSDCNRMLQLGLEPEVFISRQRCSLCQWQEACHVLAQSQQHLSLVPGVTPSRYEQLQQFGIISLEHLAAMSSPQIDEVLGVEIALQLQQQAQSLLEGKPLLRDGFEGLGRLPTSAIELYFDIEAEPDRDLDYLLGVLVRDRVTQSERFYPFLAEVPEDEGVIWQQFLDLVERYPQAPIFHFSEYEAETIERLALRYPIPIARLKPLLERLIDLHYWTTQSVIVPVESYSLKSLAVWVGFEWRDRGVNGESAVCWYDRWLQNGDRALLNAIVRYNEDDCRATRYLKDWLATFLSLNAAR
ncbi:TM0106 family RecB-like putative nuclease [Oscillatoria sp. FACHB-1406]|uniref:TM0106 family RecB-like putative nuclease n=1 Tax=Oscillatoria sp. FACHB-1406 TaxID=2692846 RepID=UPI0016883058|nr:TM0106 family RecB-like putative nuclease [Oscillatoria sp. FACHB-1406]MBD2578942.1 TM0106 family RecB-like putative nuclease [Oscillatoria sp. FACHB-1406]